MILNIGAVTYSYSFLVSSTNAHGEPLYVAISLTYFMHIWRYVLMKNTNVYVAIDCFSCPRCGRIRCADRQTARRIVSQ